MWRIIRLFNWIFIFSLLLPIPSIGMVGAYNPVTHLAYCSSGDVCLHEIGHSIDQSLGYPSQTYEFRNTLQIYIVTEFKRDNPSELSIRIVNTLMTSKQNQMREVYANLYKWTDGKEANMPESLRKFYTYDKSGKLLLQVESRRLYVE